MVTLIQKKVHIICPNGHIDRMPLPEDPRQMPGFSMALQLPNGSVRATQLCRLCWHEFMEDNFPAKVLPDDATEEECLALIETWQAERAAKSAEFMANLQMQGEEQVRAAGEAAGREAAEGKSDA